MALVGGAFAVTQTWIEQNLGQNIMVIWRNKQSPAGRN